MDTRITQRIVEIVRRPVRGLHFVLDVSNSQGKPVTQILFSPSARPIVEVWDYLEELRMRRTSRYNSLKRHCNDLCHFYNFLHVVNIKIERISSEQFSMFIEYLLTLDPYVESRPKEAFAKSIYESLPILPSCKEEKVLAFKKGIGLSPKSIARIVRAAWRYMEWLTTCSSYRCRFVKVDMMLLEDISGNSRKRAESYHSRVREEWAGYLKAKGINPYPGIESLDRNRVFTAAEIEQFEKAIKHPRDRFLFYIKKLKGMRISEILSLRWIDCPKRNPGQGIIRWNIHALKGDIYYDGNHWGIWVNQRKSNKQFWVFIEKTKQQEFERLLDRYLTWRSKQIKGEDLSWVFVKQSGCGAPLTYGAIRQQFLRIKGYAGLMHRRELTMHSFRHTKITSEAEQGIPLAISIQDTGHSEETARQVYLHQDPQKRLQITESVHDYLERSLNR